MENQNANKKIESVHESKVQKLTPLDREETNSKKNEALEEFRNMRLYAETANHLEKLCDQLNGSGPKRVQPRDIVKSALKKMTNVDFETVKESKLTATDRFEQLYQKMKSGRSDFSREMFLETLLQQIPGASTTSISKAGENR